MASAAALGILIDAIHSVDADRGGEPAGWDTDPISHHPAAPVPAMLQMIRHASLGKGGMNLAVKVRRQRVDPADQLEAPIGGLDTLARAFLCAAALYESGEPERALAERYGACGGERRLRIEAAASLDSRAAHVPAQGVSPLPKSGRQERLGGG